MSRIPILTYHNIDPAPANIASSELYVTPEQFDRQMWAMRRLGLLGVSVSAGFRGIQASGRTNQVILTFDDGYADNLLQAAPILKAYGFSATCYLVSDCIGSHNKWDAERLGVQKPLMDFRQVSSWLEAGHEIGSHTCSHPRLDHLEADAATHEIEAARSGLFARFGVVVEHFCYPYGRFSDDTVRIVKRAGYRTAVSTARGIACERDDPYRLPRISIAGGIGLLKFAVKIATTYEDRRGSGGAE